MCPVRQSDIDWLSPLTNGNLQADMETCSRPHWHLSASHNLNLESSAARHAIASILPSAVPLWRACISSCPSSDQANVAREARLVLASATAID